MVLKKSKEKIQPDMGTISIEEWDALLKSLKNEKWRQCLDNVSAEGIQRRKQWFTNSSKALFYKNIKKIGKDKFLDVGAGSGVISAELSKIFRTGISLDFSKHTTQFMKIRYMQDKISNLKVVRGDGLFLPFKSKNFDLIVVNGVLEWIADRPGNKNCRIIQNNFLKELRRCVKDDGIVAIAIENRWNLSFLLGGSPHGEPPFIAIIPRLLARFMSILIKKKDYKNYIYSYFGYKCLLKNAGYKKINIYIAIPNYYRPKYIGHISDKMLSNLIFETKGQFKGKRVEILKLLDRLGLLPLFCHSYFITASKNDL